MTLKTEILVKEEESFLQGKLTSSKKLSEEKHIYRQDLAEDLTISPHTLGRRINNTILF